MRKQNLLSKKIGKQISTINNLLENYFNSLRRFILDVRRLRFDKNNRVFLTIVSIIFLTIIYFLIPTAYNKELIEKEIKNQIYQKYNLAIKFDNEVQYNFFPKPHFSSKNLSILNDQSKVGEVKNFKIFIEFKNFFNFNQIQTQDVIFDKAAFNIKESDLSLFKNLLKSLTSSGIKNISALPPVLSQVFEAKLKLKDNFPFKNKFCIFLYVFSLFIIVLI